MAIKIVEHALEYQERVQAFNRRMKQKGSDWAFYVHPIPKWLPKTDGQPVWRQYYLALDDKGEVRGGYCLKRQAFWFGGRVQQIASFQGPVSEGVVDRKHSLVAPIMMRNMLAREPNIFAFGSNVDVTRLLQASKWWLSRTPVCLKVIKPYRFLRLNRMLRNSTARRCMLDGLALSGLGWVGLKAMAAMRKIVHRCPVNAEYETVEAFGDWTDELWRRSRDSYDILAVRNQQALNLLMPQGDWPPVIRLKVKLKGQVIGAAAVLDTVMHNDSRFGSLRVGAIVENLAPLEHCGRIVAAATDLLQQRGVDLVISYQTHPQWLKGFGANGFHVVQGRRALALSPSLQRQWKPNGPVLHGLHMNSLDGDGPLGLAPTGSPQSAIYSDHAESASVDE